MQIRKKGFSVKNKVSVNDCQYAIVDGRRHLLGVKVAKICQNKLQHAIGVDLLEIVLCDEGDLERQAGDFQLFALLLLQRTCLDVTINDDGDELIKLMGD